MPLIVERRRCASSPWIIILWVLIVFAFPLVLFKYIFRLHSPYFYIAYASLFLVVTYVAFSEKTAAQPTRGEWPPPTSASSGQTVDVEMPVFDYRRCKDEVQDGSGAQCVICLSKYDEADQPALSLPSCRHNFHVECIRKWLRSHGRCPICSAAPFPSQAAPPARLDVVRVAVLVDPLR